METATETAMGMRTGIATIAINMNGNRTIIQTGTTIQSNLENWRIILDC